MILPISLALTGAPVPAAAGISDTVVAGPFLLAGLLAVAAGLVSFASPCVVPLVPGYLSYLTGLVGADVGAGAHAGPSPRPVGQRTSTARGVAEVSASPALGPAGAIRWRILGAAALFVLGFSVVFVAESALVLGIYTTIIANQVLLMRVSGVIAIVMGLVLALPALQREWRPGLRRVASDRRGTGGSAPAGIGRGRLWGAPVLGAAFGTGWLACTSPTLAGIIALASATDWNGNAWRGLALVVLYCAGLGIPFLLLALGFGWAATALAFLRRHARGIQLGGAIALTLIGVAMVTGLWGYLLAPLQGAALLL